MQQAYANQEALAHYNRALAICERLGDKIDPLLLLTMYAGKGAVHFLLSEFLLSVEAYQHMLDITRQVGDREKEAKALNWIGDCFFYAHEFEKAMEFSSEAKALASEVHSQDILAASLVVMGEVYLVTGKLTDATPYLAEALEKSRETDDVDIEGLSLHWLGLLHNWRGESREAISLHEQGVAIGHTHNRLHISLENRWDRGIALCHKGEYEQARVSLREALGESERLGDKYFKCRIFNTLGWMYGELYNLEPAIRYNQEGAEASYKLGDPEIIRNAEINLGDYYLLRGDIEQAQQYLEKVYRDSQQRGKRGEEWMKWRYMQHCCHSLGELWLTKGDAEKALQLAEECLQLAEPTESRKNIVKGWRLQGQAYCLQGKLAEAEAILQKALALAKEIGNPPQLWKTYQALGELYEKQGATEQARSAYANTIEVIEAVASQLQDQELKRIFLSARPVQEIQERRQNN